MYLHYEVRGYHLASSNSGRQNVSYSETVIKIGVLYLFSHSNNEINYLIDILSGISFCAINITSYDKLIAKMFITSHVFLRWNAFQQYMKTNVCNVRYDF